MNNQKQWEIVVTDFIEENLDWELKQFESMPNVEFKSYQLKHSSEPEIIKRIEDADIIVVNMVTFNKKVIQSLQNCQLIIRHGVGYDNIDVSELTKKGIIFINIPDYCIVEVAEQAVMHILTCARKFRYQQKSIQLSVKSGEWDFDVVYPIHQLSYKTLGIIGCGRIGSMVYRMMQGFEMNYLIYDPYLTTERKVELGIETVPLEKVLRESDFITVHTPLNEETLHMVSEAELRIMKPNAFIINTARGGIFDENEVVKACTNGWIAGAAIDVYEYREPPQKKAKLLQVENINLTPHLAWYSVEAEWKIREKIIENIFLLLDGKIPNKIINLEVLSNTNI